MNRYHGVKCPVCENEFTEYDNIVVCPDCGAPYHKECAVKNGGCVFASRHGQGFHFELPKKNTQEEENKESITVCPNCGHKNNDELIFCESCGAPLLHRENGFNSGYDSPYSGRRYQSQPGFFQMFVMENEKINPDEEIGGEKAGDIAAYVGENAGYFINRFRALQAKEGGLNRFNLAALLFEYWYFIYRKMWSVAALYFLLSAFLSAPSFLIFLNRNNIQSFGLPVDTLLILNSAFYMLSVILRGTFSFFANKIYMKKVFKSIEKIKKTAQSPEDYRSKLEKSGSVSKIGLIVCIAICCLVAFIGYSIIIFTHGDNLF